MSFARLQTRTRHPSAFTLVELMIVIAIVGVLASLITVGVMKAFERSKLVSARIEISQLEAAVAAAKLDLGNVDELPSILKLYNTPAAFQSDQIGKDTLNLLTKAFGKTWTANTTCNWMGPNFTGPYPVTISGMEALVYWLGGIKDSTGAFQGFSSNKTTPWDLTTTKRKGPYYEFDSARVTNKTSLTLASSYNNGWDGPYLYFSKSFYNTPINGVNAYRSNNSPATLPATYPPYPASYFYNPKTFQIISSGQDQTFGPGGYYQPPFTIGVPGYDDLSNFSSTILGKKDE